MVVQLSIFSEIQLVGIADNFLLDGSFESVEIHGNGNVNDTFLLKYFDNDNLYRYTLQRINHDVFKNPQGLMDNFSRVTKHLQNKFESSETKYCALSLVNTKDGQSFHIDRDGNYWRITKFIDGGRSFEVPKDLNQAYEAGRSFGEFQFQLRDLPGNPLVETIPDFHNTKLRFDHFCKAVSADSSKRLTEVGDLVDFAYSRENLTNIIEADRFPVRTVHNDTKLNNVLLHKSSGKGMCVVDLDTVMPGCVLHDFGDLVRTAACTSNEDEKDLTKVLFEPNTFEVITKGYLETAGKMLQEIEINHLAISPLIITYELGLRFLSDYLEGDAYFKIKYPEHNLDRTKAQFKLLTSMEEKIEKMKNIVCEISSSCV